jgi:hypothetical protein
LFKIKWLLILSYFLISAASGAGLALPSISGTDNKLIDDYLRIHRQFSNSVCSGGAEQEFWKLDHAFRGDGHFIPLTIGDQLDRTTVVKHLPEVRKKLVWIDGLIDRLKKQSNFAQAQERLRTLEAGLGELLKLKHDHYLARTTEDQKKIEKLSLERIARFRVEFESLMHELYFLKSYNYPLDHFELRKEYDRWKSSTVAEEKILANDIFFYRQIVQDGAQDPDHKRSDRFLRALIDSLKLELDRHSAPLLDEDLRYDFSSFITMTQTHLSRGVAQKISRLEEWRERTHRAILFYSSLITPNPALVSGEASGDAVVSSRTKARYALRDYNFSRQREVYDFWRAQPELMKALFSIETILYNEVGSIDGSEGLERKDVTQIVLNRFRDNFYSSLTTKDGLFPYLSHLKAEQIQQERWLNLLFKDGEFSFTYFFINSSVRIYCPDMTRTGRWLRRQNLKIAIEQLRDPDWGFRAMRYYSRHSMQGRMRMDALWTDYEPIRERPGVRHLDQVGLKRRRAANDYRFLYHFLGPDNVSYQVLEMGREIVVFSEPAQEYFTWRNPQLFKYFTPKAP